MDIYSKEKWAETKSGYNPLKEDFENTSFFVTDVDRNKWYYYCSLFILLQNSIQIEKLITYSQK